MKKSVKIIIAVVAVVLAVVFAVLCLRLPKRPIEVTLAAGLLLVHSLADFTLQFLPICALLLALLFFALEPEEAAAGAAVGCRAVLLVCALVFASLFGTQQVIKSVGGRVQAADWKGVDAACQRWDFALGASHDARLYHLYALMAMGRYQEVLDQTGDVCGLGEQLLLVRAQALEASGNRDEACRLLLGELRHQLYNTILFSKTAQLLQRWEAGSDVVEEYNQIVDQANGSRTILGTWKGDQIDIGKIM